MTDQALMSHFNFTEADLQANRTGQFSEAQKQSLRKEDQAGRKWEFFGGGCLILIGLVGLGPAVAGGTAFPDPGARLGPGVMFGRNRPRLSSGFGVPPVFPGLAKA